VALPSFPLHTERLTFRNKHRHPFEKRLIDIRRRIQPEPFDWYRFDTFANLSQFEALLPGGLDALVALAGDEPVADIGAGDGDLAFLLESLGCAVTVIDWPGTNANHMRGVRLLKRELGSSIGIREVDIDSQFRLDGDRFGLVLSLGLLYHLKNPFYFLERLAVHSRHCVLSTRILPRGRTTDPVGWLTNDREFENDPTNYWFFSEAGVLRLLDRCGWDVTRANITGDGKDDRFFCLAESRVAKNAAVIRLLYGWHQQENNAWRWTGPEFGAVVENTEGATAFELRFRIESARPVTVQAEVNGVTLAERCYQTAGDHVYREPIHPAGRRNEIRVHLTGSFQSEGRELGVIVRLPPNTLIDEECGIHIL
jgi:tRNA (mo5U34)-methyltransferase